MVLEHYTQQKPKEETLKDLSRQLYETDLLLKDLKKANQRIIGTDQDAFTGMVGEHYTEPLNINDVLKGVTSPEKIDQLHQQAKSIIEKMIVIDPTVKLDVFQEYGY
jgi:hypothetical protein